MRLPVLRCFAAFSESFEGAVAWFYLDIYGWVTIAIGNLMDRTDVRLEAAPVAALALPMVDKTTGVPASRAEIDAEWRFVKNHKTAAKQGHRVLEAVTRLRLTKEGVDQVLANKRDEMAAYLEAHHFADFEEWNCDAQLATLSMAWACGANWPARFPRCKAALLQRDFAAAAAECRIDTDGPDRIPNTADDNRGVIPRNVANRQLFLNAALQAAAHEDDFLDAKLAHAAVESSIVTAAQLMTAAPIIRAPLEWSTLLPPPREV